MKNSQPEDKKFNIISHTVSQKLWDILSQDIFENKKIEEDPKHMLTALCFITLINNYLECVKDDTDNEISFDQYLNVMKNFNDNLA